MSLIQKALVAAMNEIAKKGIAKTSRANLGGATVDFRGIEAAMNEMSGVLIRHGISVTPSYSELNVTERAKGEGKATRFVTIKGAFTFAAEDASSVVCTVYGEAMDSGDKAVTKAQSVAFRTALFQQFVVPTMAMDPEGNEGEDDVPEAALKAAEKGMIAYQAYWKALSPDQKKALEPHHTELKNVANDSDARGA